MKTQKKQTKAKKVLKTVLTVILCVVATAGFLTLLFNVIVIAKGGAGIRNIDDTDIDGPDCILVLGCGVKPDGTPSDMLRDRIETGVELYKAGAAPKILMSGDHGQDDYDEVGAMKRYAESLGVPPEDIFLDHAGFCTYDSIVRAAKVFGVKKMIVVTQKYHLFRAVFLAESFGIECRGVAADLHKYRGAAMREVREVFGRCKDLLNTVFRPDPKYLGDAIDISGDGTVTHDGEKVTPIPATD